MTPKCLFYSTAIYFMFVFMLFLTSSYCCCIVDKVPKKEPAIKYFVGLVIPCVSRTYD